MKIIKHVSLVVIAGILLSLAGCERDEVKKQTKIGNDPYFEKDYVYTLLKKNPQTGNRTRNDDVDILIRKVWDYINNHDLDSVKTKIENSFGYPVWNITEFVIEPTKTTTITPIYSPTKGLITNFIFTISDRDNIRILYPDKTEKLEFDILQSYFTNKLHDISNIVCFKKLTETDGGGSEPVVGFEDCTKIVNLTTVKTITEGNSGYEIQPSWTAVDQNTIAHNTFISSSEIVTTFYTVDIDLDCPENQSVGSYDISTSFGGATGGYLSQTSTWEGCKLFMKDRGGINTSETEAIRKMIFENQTCGGCFKAMMASDAFIKYWQNATSPKLLCHLCKTTMAEMLSNHGVFESWTNISFPCNIVDKDALLEELMPECDASKSGGGVISWSDFAEKMRGKPWFTKGIFPGKASAEVTKMSKLLGYNEREINSMSDADFCLKIGISECLSQATFGSLNSVNEADKAALIDFYKNTTLLDPCTGKEIDKDAIFTGLCSSDNVSIAGLDAALEGVDYITNALGKCPNAACMLNKLINTTGTNICEVVKKFETSSNVTFGVSISNGYLAADPDTGKIPYAETSYSGGESKITLDINRICNETFPLIVAETILHEMMHALFYESMEILGWSGSDETRNQFFDQLVNDWMSERPGKTQHEIITEYYLEPMANTLWNLNNKLGQPYDYYGLLLYGLNSNNGGLNNVIINKFHLTNQEILEAYATSLNTVVKPSSMNFINCE